ncbi:MAG: hypothetical protein ACYTHM_00665 [Planctomycetota bacterium]
MKSTSKAILYMLLAISIPGGAALAGGKHVLKDLGKGEFEIQGPEMKPVPAAGKGTQVPAGYVVLAGMKKESAYYKVAEKMAEFRKGTIVPFDPNDPNAVKEDLKKLGARYVCVVVEPSAMDVNLLHRMVTLSVALDEDPFCDFAFGFITGKTAKGAMDFVENIIKADKMALPKRFVKQGVTTSGKSRVLPSGGLSIIRAAGYPGKTVYTAAVESDKDVRAFVEKNISLLSGGGIISFGGCGDPEGIWLFSDKRNRAREKHWPYSPEKVGYDPKGEMPRVMATDFKNLELFPSVIWSGVCHMGAVENVYVMGDIVSTFGRVESITLHKMPVEKSLALTLIERGAVAMVCAITANHGFRSLIEQAHVFETGDRLGDMMRAGNHDLVIADDEGKLQGVGIFRVGGPQHDRNVHNPFWGEPQSRLLYGDPYYKPFEAVGDADKYQVSKVKAKEDGTGFEISCTIRDRIAAMYKTSVINAFWDRKWRKRVYCTVEVPVSFKTLRLTKVVARNDAGAPLPLARVVALMERIDGKSYLHISAYGPDEISKAGIALTYTVAVSGKS